MEVDSTNGSNMWDTGGVFGTTSKMFGNNNNNNNNSNHNGGDSMFGNAFSSSTSSSVFGGGSGLNGGGFGCPSFGQSSNNNNNNNSFSGFASFSSTSPAFSTSRPTFSHSSAFSASTPAFPSSSSSSFSSSSSSNAFPFASYSSSSSLTDNFSLTPMTSTFFFDNSTNHTTSVFSQSTSSLTNNFPFASSQNDDNITMHGEGAAGGRGGRRGGNSKSHDKVCRYWLMPKGCKSDNCTFSHPADQDGTKMNVIMQQAKEIEVCRYWQLATCKNNLCSFAHPPDQFGISKSSSSSGSSGSGNSSSVSMKIEKEKEICNFWLKGTCKNNPCRHGHPPELEGSNRKEQNVVMQAVKETPVCKYWINGNCKSSPCLFLHPPEQDGRKDNVSMQPVRGGKEREQEVCKYWLKGKCTNDPCLYTHPAQDMKSSYGNGSNNSNHQFQPQKVSGLGNRDDVCIYWQRGSCKNENCQFRHPTSASSVSSSSSSFPSSSSSSSPSTPTSSSASQQRGSNSVAKFPISSPERIVCTYYLKGFCTREECAFQHVPRTDLRNSPEKRPDRGARTTPLVVKRADKKSGFATPQKSTQDIAAPYSPIAKPEFFSPAPSFQPITAPTTSAITQTTSSSAQREDETVENWEQYEEEPKPEEQAFERWQATEVEEGSENWQAGEDLEYGEEDEEQGLCEYCGDPHSSMECPILQESQIASAATAAASTATGRTSAHKTSPLKQPYLSSSSSSSRITPSLFSSAFSALIPSSSAAFPNRAKTEEQQPKKRPAKAKPVVEECENCGGEHSSAHCPSNQEYDNDNEEEDSGGRGSKASREGQSDEEEENEEVVPLPTSKKNKRLPKTAKLAKPKKGPVVVNVKVSSRGVITPVQMTDEQAAARRNKFGGGINSSSSNGSGGSCSSSNSSNATCDICSDRHPSNMCPVLRDCGTPAFLDDNGRKSFPSISSSFPPELKENVSLRRRDDGAGGGEDDFEDLGNAIVGECLGMCPEQEIIDRNGRDVSVFEQGNSRLELDRDLAVKKYKRAAAGQKMNAREVRPPHVLRKVLLYLCDEILDQDVELLTLFDFVSDRFRAIRQDYLCQAQNDELCLASFETMLRFHIMMLHELSTVEIGTLNVSKLTQTMTSLMRWYSEARLSGKPEVNEAEFRAYQLLFYMFDRTMFMAHLTEMPAEIRKSEQVKFATQVYLAKQECNYVRFFQLVKQATYLQACCMHKLFNEMRVGALRRMATCYKGKHVPLSTLSSMLLFESEEEAKEFFMFHNVALMVTNNEVLINFTAINGGFEPEEKVFPRSLSTVITNKKPASLNLVVLPPHDPRLRNATGSSSGGVKNVNKQKMDVSKLNVIETPSKKERAFRQAAIESMKARRQATTATTTTTAASNTISAFASPTSTAKSGGKGLNVSGGDVVAGSMASAFGMSTPKTTPMLLDRAPLSTASTATANKTRIEMSVKKATTAAHQASVFTEQAKQATERCAQVVKNFELTIQIEQKSMKKYFNIWYTATQKIKEEKNNNTTLNGEDMCIRADEFRKEKLMKKTFLFLHHVFLLTQQQKIKKFQLKKWFLLWRNALYQRNKKLALFSLPDPTSTFRTSFISPFEKLRIFGRSEAEDMDLSASASTTPNHHTSSSCSSFLSLSSTPFSTSLTPTTTITTTTPLLLTAAAATTVPTATTIEIESKDWNPLDISKIAYSSLQKRNCDFDLLFFNLALSLPPSSSSPSSPLVCAASQWLTKKFSHTVDQATQDCFWATNGGLQSLIIKTEGKNLSPSEGRGLQGVICLLSVELTQLSVEGVTEFAQQVKKIDVPRLRSLVSSLHPLSRVPLLVLYTVSTSCFSALQNQQVYDAVQDHVSRLLPSSLALPRSLASRVCDSHIILLLEPPHAVPFSSQALIKGVQWLAQSCPPYPQLGSLSLCRMLDHHVGLHKDYLREFVECVEGPKVWIEHFNLAVKDILNVLESYCRDASWPPFVPKGCVLALPDQWWAVAQVQAQVSSLLLPAWPWPSRAMTPAEAWALWQQYLVTIPSLTPSQTAIQPAYFVDALLTTSSTVSPTDWCKCMECLFSQRLSLFRSYASALRAVCPLAVPVAELLLSAFNQRKVFKKPNVPNMISDCETAADANTPLWAAEPLSTSLEEEQDRSRGFGSRLSETEQHLRVRQQQQERQQRRRRKRRQHDKSQN